MTELQEHFDHIRGRIADAATRSGRNLAEVTLVAVSKTHPSESLAALHALGQRDFGESYVQEALPKMESLADKDIRWHFIGHLQTNKAKYCVGRFCLFHTLDSEKLAQALHTLAQAKGQRQAVLLQVNVGDEPQKSGIDLARVEALAATVLGFSGLDLAGLMCLPPYDEDPDATRPYFVALRQCRERLETRLGIVLPHLSMGMSTDFEAAVEEGATLVRVGSSIFGARPCLRNP